MGRKSKATMLDSRGRSLNLFLSPDSRYWYQRHLERDNAIHELIDDSRYGRKTVTVVGAETAKVATSVVWGTAVGAVSALAGYGIAYYGASGDAAALGLGVAITGVNYSVNMVRRTLSDSAQGAEQELDPSDAYRFVRFLPEYLWMGWSNDKLPSPLRISVEREGRVYDLMTTAAVTHPDSQVYLTRFSDVDADSVGQEMWLTHEEKWRRWLDGFNGILSAPYRGKTNWDYWQEISKSITQVTRAVSAEDEGWDFSRNFKVIFSEKSIVVEFRKGLFHENPVLTIDLQSQSLHADEATQKLLLSSYAPAELLNEIDERAYALEDREKKSAAKKRCDWYNRVSKEFHDCVAANMKERPRRAALLNASF